MRIMFKKEITKNVRNICKGKTIFLNAKIYKTKREKIENLVDSLLLLSRRTL